MISRKTIKVEPKEKPQPKAKLIVIIVHQNSPDHLKLCMQSLLEQSYGNLDVIFIDNNSSDKEGLEFMHENYDSEKKVTIISNTDNRSFAKAANRGIKIAVGREAKYISVIEPEVIISPDYYEKLIDYCQKRPKVASATGKIFIYDFVNLKPTDIIDSSGLKAFRNRRIEEAGKGMVDDGQFNEEKEIFGVSGICPLYRVEALENVKIMEEYFDEDFEEYKEDMDLAWRFLLYGWKNVYLPDAIAYHSEMEEDRAKKHSIKVQKEKAFRNQLLMEKKNELWGSFWKDFGPIMSVKLATPLYITFAQPHLWKGYLGYVKRFPRILKKRFLIMKNKKASAKEMGGWFKGKSFQRKG
ncbi:MAG: glycosyltransferase family 2 protein [Candidatus Gracilibacteria bacterium]|nr:glycosyltransferase family 2 protein [Candidatus Gracilibacteria bacterium]